MGKNRNKIQVVQKQGVNNRSHVPVVERRVEMYSGPLPSPDILSKYDAVYTGAAEIILKRFEKQSEHRIDIEKKVIYSNENRADKGQKYAFILLGILLVGSIVLLAIDKMTEGFTTLSVSIVTGITALIGGQINKKKSLEDKDPKTTVSTNKSGNGTIQSLE